MNEFDWKRAKPKKALFGYKKWDKDQPHLSKVVTLGSVAHRLLDALGLTEKFREHQAVIRWDEFVGPKIAQVTEATSISNGTLYVKVSSDPWRNELQYMREQIIYKINKTLGDEVVKEIKFS